MTTISTTEYSCTQCNDTFASRNKLFKHLKLCIGTSGGTENAVSVAPEVIADTPVDVSGYYIYVTGGRLRGRTLGSVERYCLSSGEWEQCVPSLLENRGSHGALAIEKTVFVMGGGGFDSNLATCEAYDCQAKTWHGISPMETYRHALILASVNVNPENASDINSPQKKPKLEGGSATATESTNMPTVPPKGWQIYAIGGWVNGSVCAADTERYDVQSNQWTRCANMKVPRRLLGATDVDGKIYAFGGNIDDAANTKVWYSAAVESYDPVMDMWEGKRDLPHAGPTSAVTVGGIVYVFIHGREVYRYDHKNDEYTRLSALPLPEWYCFDVCALAHYVYLIGGATKGTWSKATYLYNTLTDMWTQLPDMRVQRRRCAAALVYEG
jgi:hypothetical protein